MFNLKKKRFCSILKCYIKEKKENTHIVKLKAIFVAYIKKTPT